MHPRVNHMLYILVQCPIMSIYDDMDQNIENLFKVVAIYSFKWVSQ